MIIGMQAEDKIIGMMSAVFYCLMIFALCWDKLSQGETRLSFSDMEGWKIVFFMTILSNWYLNGLTEQCTKIKKNLKKNMEVIVDFSP